MALQCPHCGRQYDVTLFEFQRSVLCVCGAALDLEVGHIICQAPRDSAALVARPDGQAGPITAATWDYITSRHIADDYDRYFQYNELFSYDTQVLDRWLPEPGRLIDLGCGTGRHVAHFAARGFDVTGVDLSDHMLATTRRKLAARQCGATLVQGDLTRIEDLGLGRFRTALCMFSTLGMIYGAGSRMAFLRAVRGLLEPDGLLAFHVHNRWHSLWYPEGRQYLRRALRACVARQPEAFQKDVDGYRGIHRMSLYVFSAREIRRVVTQAGFRVQEMVYLNQVRNGALRGLARGLRANGFLIACRVG